MKAPIIVLTRKDFPKHERKSIPNKYVVDSPEGKSFFDHVGEAFEHARDSGSSHVTFSHRFAVKVFDMFTTDSYKLPWVQVVYNPVKKPTE
jgi:hypothetical protein